MLLQVRSKLSKRKERYQQQRNAFADAGKPGDADVPDVMMLCTSVLPGPWGHGWEGIIHHSSQSTNRLPCVANIPRGPKPEEKSSTVTRTPRFLQFNQIVVLATTSTSAMYDHNSYFQEEETDHNSRYQGYNWTSSINFSGHSRS